MAAPEHRHAVHSVVVLAAGNVRNGWKADIASQPFPLHLPRVEIYKDQLPSGLSYALRPSVLKAALEARGVMTEVRLYQSLRGWSESRVLFAAHFYPARRYYRNDNELLTVTSRAVPSTLRHEAKTFLEGVVLSEFIDWVTSLERLPEHSTIRREPQEFVRPWVPEEDEQA